MALKEIHIDQLAVNMYVDHIIEEEGVRLPKRRSGRISDPRIVDKFREIGVRNLVINLDKGVDVPEPEEANDDIPHDDEAIDNALTFFAEETGSDYRALGFEWFTAKEIFSVCTGILVESYAKIRRGESLIPEQFAQAASAINLSLRRNKDALIWFGKLRNTDRYNYEHAVNCAVLTGVFCQSLEMSDQEIQAAIAGAMLQNIGEARLPDELLVKSGKLSDEEMTLMQSHVTESEAIIASHEGVPKITREIILQHHERVDGSGYPLGLKDAEISRFAKIVAIVDSYDALATRKAYREAMPPSQAMKVVLQDSKTRYDEALVHQFIKCMGIYPTGTLVRLNNDMLAIVTEQSPTERLKPDVKVIFNSKTKAYSQPYPLRLSSPGLPEKIVGYEDPRKWEINVTDFMPNDEYFAQFA